MIYHKYTITDNRIEIVKALFLRKYSIDISQISSIAIKDSFWARMHVYYVVLNLKEFKDSVKANSSIYAGANCNSSYAFPDSPKPLQTPHFSVEYKTKGFGDKNIEKLAFYSYKNRNKFYDNLKIFMKRKS